MKNKTTLPDLCITSFCHGNNDAIVGIYKLWLPQLYLIAYRYLKSQEEAEDIVADCFEKLLKMPVELRHKKFIQEQIELKSLLIVIVKNKSLDALKTKNNRFRIMDTLKNWMPTSTYNNSIQHFTDEDFSVLSKTLSEKERTIITLNIEGYSHKEISNRLNITEKTVSNTLSITRKKMGELWDVFMK